MSNALFPTLPGLTWELDLTPTFSTIIQRSSTRQEARLAQDLHPLYTFDLVYEFLRDDPALAGVSSANPLRFTDVAQLVGFYNARGGCFDSFLLDPCLITAKPGFGRSQGLQIGVGDGVAQDFQLLWNWGGYVDEAQAIKGVPVVYANGAIVPGWTLNSHGIIHFASAPTAGFVLTADCEWYWRVRFAEDTLAIKGFSWLLYECQAVKLQQVRDE